MKNRAKVGLAILTAIALGIVVGATWTAIDAAKRREQWTQAMWFLVNVQNDSTAEDIYFTRPASDAVGALLTRIAQLEHCRDIIVTNRMLGTNYFNQSAYYLNARLAKLYEELGRHDEAQRHMSNAISTAKESKGVSFDSSAVLNEMAQLDALLSRGRSKKANKILHGIVADAPNREN